MYSISEDVQRATFSVLARYNTIVLDVPHSLHIVSNNEDVTNSYCTSSLILKNWVGGPCWQYWEDVTFDLVTIIEVNSHTLVLISVYIYKHKLSFKHPQTPQLSTAIHKDE